MRRRHAHGEAHPQFEAVAVARRADRVLAAWPLQEVLEGNGLDRDGAQDYTRPSSEVYRQLAAAMRAGIDDQYRQAETQDCGGAMAITHIRTEWVNEHAMASHRARTRRERQYLPYQYEPG